MNPETLFAAPFAWQKAAPAEAGFASDLAARLDRLIADKRAWGLHGVVVARARHIVLERYFEARAARSRAGEHPMKPNSSLLQFAVATLLCAAGAASAQGFACTAPQKPMMEVELLLGRGKASGASWRQFLAREVTPRFPDGLTVYDTYGQWRDPKRNVIVRERSRVLRIIVPADAPAQYNIAAVAEAYKSQFRQKSVGIVTRPACVSF